MERLRRSIGPLDALAVSSAQEAGAVTPLAPDRTLVCVLDPFAPPLCVARASTGRNPGFWERTRNPPTISVGGAIGEPAAAARARRAAVALLSLVRRFPPGLARILFLLCSNLGIHVFPSLPIDG